MRCGEDPAESLSKEQTHMYAGHHIDLHSRLFLHDLQAAGHRYPPDFQLLFRMLSQKRTLIRGLAIIV